MNVTFETLPQFVANLYEKVNNCERLLLNLSDVNQSDTIKWFDIKELCAYLPDKPKLQTVYGWVRERKIPSHKKTKKLTFLKSEIDEWIKSGSGKTYSEINQATETYLKPQKIRRRKDA